MWWLAPLLSYLFGGLQIAWWIGSKNKHIDLRAIGSKNPGTSNLFRNAGFAVAAVAGPLQFFQGVLPVAFTRILGAPAWIVYASAIAVLLGNCWPLLNHFRGQRGIAVAVGAVAAANLTAFGVLLVMLGTGAVVHKIAIAVLLGFAVMPEIALLTAGSGLAATFGIFLFVIILRRLTGSEDAALTKEVLLNRLLWDRTPGQRLVG